MTKAERAHLNRVAELGCIACLLDGYQDTPSEIHHPRAGSGAGQRSSHMLALPLCPAHHRTGGLGVAIHAGQKTWEKKYGTEAELLTRVTELLNGQ